jgi:glycosyltransferase involved in cell wall biosynthesis
VGSLPGIDIDVITAGVPRGSEDHSLDEFVAARFGRVRRVPVPAVVERAPSGRLGPLVNSPDPFVFLNPRLARAARDMRYRDYDLVVSRSQPHSIHLVGARLRRRGGPPWIACLSDPWAGNPYVPGRTTRAVNTALERRMLARADAVVVTSEETATLVATRTGVEPTVVPHAFWPDLYPEAQQRTGPIVVRHLGMFYGRRSPAPLLRALATLARERRDLVADLRVELIGATSGRFLSDETLRTLPEGLVRILPDVPHRRALALMRGADVLAVVDAPATLSPFLPAKLVDYVGAGRPVVAFTPPGTTRNLVRELGGWCSGLDDPGEGAEALALALDHVHAGRDRPFGDEKVRTRFDASTVGAALRAVVDRVVSS